MRWTLVTETYPPEVNGVAMTLQRLATTLAAQGHAVSVVRPRQAADRQAAKLTDTNAAAGRQVARAGDAKADMVANEQVATAGSATAGVAASEQVEPGGGGEAVESIDSVSTCFVLGLPIPGYSGLLLGRMAKYKLLKLWKAHRPDAIHIATEGPLGFSALLAARKLGIPVVTTFHTNFHNYGEYYGLGVLKRPLMAYLRWFHNASLATFAPSADVLAQLEQAGLKRLYLMGRGVDTRLFGQHRRSEELRRSWGISAGPDVREEPVVLYAGRVASEKNLPLAIQAFERLCTHLPQARMVVVGDGPLRQRLERDYPHIRFAGMRHGEDLAAHYASADLFFFASVTETFGNVITEAMASGLVVLSYRYAAAARYIEDGTSGFTADFDNASALLAAVDRMAEQRDNWQAVRHAAAAAVADLSWERIAAGYMRRTQEIAAQAGGKSNWGETA